MKKIIITIIVSFISSTIGLQTSNAADELIQCDPEPTVMTIDLGYIVECQIDPASETDFFLFQATAGEVYVLKLLDRSSGCGGSFGYPCPVAELFDPDDPITPIATLGAGTDVEVRELEKTGTYTIRVTEAGNNQTESYRIALERLFPGSPSALSIWWGDPISDTISPAPDNDFFLFDGEQDDVISLTLLDLSSGCGGSFGYPCPVAELYDPSRNLILTLGAGTDSEILALPATGTYTVHVAEAGHNQTESYNLTLECLSGPCFPIDPLPKCGGLNATIIGTQGDNIIYGTDGNDVIVGLGGNDIIFGLDGRDRICGGDGDDIIHGGGMRDRIWGQNGNDVLRGEAGQDILYGNFGHDTLDGGSWQDILDGGWGNDTLYGNAGDDELIGGEGVDVCDGGIHDTGDITDGTCECTIDIELP